MKNIKLTQSQQKVLSIIMTAGEIYVSEIAEKFYKGIRKDLRPQDTKNAMIHVIRQINKKAPGHIKELNRGCLGKLVYI